MFENCIRAHLEFPNGHCLHKEQRLCQKRKSLIILNCILGEIYDWKNIYRFLL
jgi:hypothetical protein